MSDTVLSTLRAVRNADSLVDRLKAESLEARRERIAFAMAKDNWAGGPAKLIATYPHHALANKDGVLMRVRVTEDEDKIAFDKIEVLDLPVPPTSVADEVMETALAAVDLVYEDKVSEASPLIRALANAIYTSGDLRRKIMSEVARRSVRRDAWWHAVVAEHLGDTEPTPSTKIAADGLPAAAAALQAQLKEHAARAAKAMKALGEMADTPDAVTVAAKDIAADFKYAIHALEGVDREDIEALAGVYEGVEVVASQLQAGVRFLEGLAGKDGSEE